VPYRFATERQDYTDYAGGRVFYALPGQPAFPVRLGSEIFQRCLSLIVQERGVPSGRVVLFDPCCGGATHLAALAYLHWDSIGEIVASDIDLEALDLARRNLSLLSLEGLDRRMAEIERLVGEYGKNSHASALESAGRLRKSLESLASRRPLPVHLFQADAASPQALLAGLGDRPVDVALADIPYGRLSTWQDVGAAHETSLGPAGRMLAALRSVLSPQAVVAVASDKGQKVAHPAYCQVGKMRQGKRQVVFLYPREAVGR
jgi:hypothetical protein